MRVKVKDMITGTSCVGFRAFGKYSGKHWSPQDTSGGSQSSGVLSFKTVGFFSEPLSHTRVEN